MMVNKKSNKSRKQDQGAELAEVVKKANWLKSGEAAVGYIDKDGKRRWKRMKVKLRPVPNRRRKAS